MQSVESIGNYHIPAWAILLLVDNNHQGLSHSQIESAREWVSSEFINKGWTSLTFVRSKVLDVDTCPAFGYISSDTYLTTVYGHKTIDTAVIGEVVSELVSYEDLSEMARLSMILKQKQAEASKTLVAIAKSLAIQRLVPNAFEHGNVKSFWRVKCGSTRDNFAPELDTLTITMGDGTQHVFPASEVPEVLHSKE